MKTLKEIIVSFYDNSISDVEEISDNIFLISCNGLKMTTVKIMDDGVIMEFDHCFKETRERKICIQANGDIMLS